LLFCNLFTYSGFEHDFNIKSYSCCLILPRRLPIIKQIMPTPPEYLGLSRFYRSNDGAQFLVFCVAFCWPLFVLLVIILSVIFWLSASNYPCRIFIFSYPSHSAFSMPLSIFNSIFLFFISIMISKHLSFYNNNLAKLRFWKK
jgi:hypothetical protein